MTDIVLVRDSDTDEADQARVRDVDLGERLGFERPRTIRTLIKTHLPTLRKFGDVPMRSAVQRIEKRGAIKGFEERTVNEYLLNKDQSLFIVTQSGTEMAAQVTATLIQSYNALREQLRRALETGADRSFRRMLVESKRTTEKLWANDVPRELARICGWDLSNVKGYPVWAGRMTERIYNVVVGKDVMDEARERRDKSGGHSSSNLLYHWFSDETRALFEKDLLTVYSLLVVSSDLGSFWSMLERRYQVPMSQLLLSFNDDGCPRCGAPKDIKDRFCSMCGFKLLAGAA